VNPVFDLEEIVKSAKPEIDNLYKKPLDAATLMNQGVYDKMMQQYDSFFEKEKEAAELRLNALMAGKNIHEVIKQVIKYYEESETNRHKRLLEQLDEGNTKMYQDLKKQMNQFVDGLIETLHYEFNETSVSVTSPRREKIALLKKLADELDSHYSDNKKFK
jgi:CRISPR/Cas system-associated exonuclease Cas4 (RecB family)